MNDFKGRHFEGQVILWTVRWYGKYGVSYRELEEMLEERGVCGPHHPLPMGAALRARDREAAAVVLAPATFDQLAR